MKTIIITGYDGFIGSHLVPFLQEKKYNVIGISNRLRHRNYLKNIKKDIRELKPEDIPKNVSCIIHLAALTDVDYCEKNPKKCFDINVLGTLKILETAKQHNANLIFVSSSHVFGKPKKNLIKENHPRNPITVYGASKLSAEYLCEIYSKIFDMNISIIRLFSVFGKKQSGRDVISKLVSQIKKGKTIQLGNLYPKRDFIYITDVIKSLEIIMNNSGGFQIFNVGTGKSHSIFQVYKILNELVNKNIKIESNKSFARKDDIKKIVADCSKIKKLNWKPETTLNEGLEMILYDGYSNVKSIKKCRICKSEKLTPIMSLGEQYLAGYTPKKNEPNPILKKFPLELIRCNPTRDKKACGLVQLKHSVPSDMMYRRYFYRSGINKTMKDNLKEIVEETISTVKLEKNDIVVDIGCNDGTLLKNYKKLNLRAVGFDPAKNMAKYSRRSRAKIIVDYFNSKSFKENSGNEKAKIVTSIAMFYDLENPNIFVEDVSKILKNDGVWVIELAYLPTMLKENAFDTIVHEHLEYYHFSVIEHMLRKYNLKAIDVKLNDINGGSIRIFIKHKTQKQTADEKLRITELRKYERRMKLDTNVPYNAFIKRCKREKSNLLKFINKEVKAKKKIFAYGASTKGSTLLQFYGLDNNLIEAVADRNPDKWGRRTVGTNLKIISEQEARNAKPDYFLVLPWHFIKEFRIRENEFLKKGGKLVVPLPTFQIIDN